MAQGLKGIYSLAVCEILSNMPKLFEMRRENSTIERIYRAEILSNRGKYVPFYAIA